ncbi:MAG TPA: prephenate dehydratase domain-containing protein [Gemmatimonadaceae bacterium]|nr:prephenate dehydratase domain-containing protein [Gemmatimonadaceae bacterium]
MREGLGEALPQPSPKAAAATAAVRVAFQGEPGAFSEQAIVQLWGGAADPVPMQTFDDVADAAERGLVEYGMLPIESTLVGGVDVAYDLLSEHEDLCVAGETVVRIRLSVLGLAGSTLAGLRTLASHPIMLAQCANFLDAHKHIAPEPCWDTAGAAREVLERGDPTRAAAAGPLAGERFGLEVLASRIEDRPDTMMRFLAVAPEPAVLEPGSPARTAVLCAQPNSAGALLRVIEPLARWGFNISHLASRPTREPWRYQFYLEFDHDANHELAAQAIDAIRRGATFFRHLGTFPRWNVPAD